MNNYSRILNSIFFQMLAVVKGYFTTLNTNSMATTAPETLYNGDLWYDPLAGNEVRLSTSAVIPVGASLTASTTQTRLGALALTSQWNIITTCAHSGDAVGLPTSYVGAVIYVLNAGANPASVFPAGSAETIDGGSAGAAVTLTNAKSAAFICFVAGAWVSRQLGAPSA